MFRKINKHYLLLHIIVFIWGWAPIFGRGISISALNLVWFRILITVAMMALYVLYTKDSLKVSPKKILKLSAVGIVICLHWLCFYGAIKISNISVTMAAFSTATLFTAIIEPLLLKRKVILYELGIGTIIIAAICLIFSVEIQYGWGLVLGVLAAFTASLFSVLNSMLVKDTKETIATPVFSLIELSAALIGLTVFLGFKQRFNVEFFALSNNDLILLILFSGIVTVFPFLASVNLLKHISPYTLNLAVNLEGVYGIILASIIFHENQELSFTFYLGFAIILSAIFLNAFIKQRIEKRE